MAVLPTKKSVEAEEAVRIDVTGSEAVSTVLLNLLNRFPGLKPGERIRFATLDDDGGLGFFPGAGAIYRSNTADVLGNVSQECQYLFNIVYRAAPHTEEERLQIKEFLDTLGNWLNRQPVTIGGTKYQLAEYPTLESENRVIQGIERVTPATLTAAYQDRVEDWTITSTLIYKNEIKGGKNPWPI